jgi:hypothetical protein
VRKSNLTLKNYVPTKLTSIEVPEEVLQEINILCARLNVTKKQLILTMYYMLIDGDIKIVPSNMHVSGIPDDLRTIYKLKTICSKCNSQITTKTNR